MALTPKEQFEKRKAALILERASFIPQYRDLSDYIAPRRGRFFLTDRNRGDRRNTKIINSAASLALRTLVAGFVAGATSPARPWFRLGTPDDGLMQYGPVKLWLAQVERLMYEIFNQSNLYTSLPNIYAETGGFGTACLTIVEDYEDVICTYPHTVGSYLIAQNGKRKVDTIYREFQMTVGQMMGQFKKENVSATVRNLYDRGSTEAWVDVVQAIEPNDGRDITLKSSKNKKFRSVHYEPGNGEKEKLLRESGYDEFPGMCPRWDLAGEDIYGTDCPGMTSLGDVKALQIEERRKAQAIDKMSNPPLKGPGSLRNVPVSSLPGSLTTYDAQPNSEGLTPIYQVNPRIAELMQDIQSVERRIDKAFYADLFLMLAMSEQNGTTAREVEERHQEKLVQLGPVLERLHGDLLSPVIDRTFAMMARHNLLPPPPPELQGTPLKVKYISLLAQAQQAAGVQSVNAFASFIGGLAQIRPEAADKLDVDQAIDWYADTLMIPPKLVVSEDKVAGVRADRAKQQAQQMAMAMAQPAADAAKKLSDAKLADGSDPLSRMAGVSR